MGIRGNSGHLAGQDAERHAAETPRGQVLGGAQGGGGETTGTPVRELRGGWCVILPESAPPPHSSAQVTAVVIGHGMSRNWGCVGLKMTRRLSLCNIVLGAMQQVWLQKSQRGNNVL